MLKNKKKFIINFVIFSYFIVAIFLSLGQPFKATSFFSDPGSLWHLRDGENIIKNLSFVYFDDFLSVKRPWISDQWLMDSIYYLIYRQGGLSLIFYVSLIIYILLFFKVLFDYIQKKTNNLFLTILLCYISFFSCTIHFVFRPVMFSFVFFILFLIFLDNYDNKKNTTKQNGCFFILFLLWANIHPSFVMAFLIWGIYLFENLLRKFEKRSLKDLFLTSLIILFATLINPYFIKLHESIFFLGTNKFFMNLNQEWLPVPFKSITGILASVLMFISVLYFIFNKDKKHINYTLFLSQIIFYIYGMRHLRGTTYFSITSSVFIANYINDFLNFKFFKNIFVIRLIPKLINFVNSNLNKKLTFPCLIILPLIIIISFLSIKDIKLKPHRYVFPEKVSKVAIKQNLKGITFASPNLGGYIIWHIRNIKPIIDDRNTLSGEKAYKDFFNTIKSEKKFKKYLKENNANFAIISKNDDGRILFNNSKKFKFLKRIAKSRKFYLYKVIN